MAIVIDISSKTSLGSLKYISFLLKNFNNKNMVLIKLLFGVLTSLKINYNTKKHYL